MMNLAFLTTQYRVALIAKSFKRWVIRNQRYADVGCGNGVVSHYLAKVLKIDITGCDILKYLKYDIPFKKMRSVGKIPFNNNSFDGVMINDVLHHMSYRNQKKILNEGCRVAKKLLIFEEEPTYLAKIFDYLLNKIHNSQMDVPLSYRSRKEWENLFKQMRYKYRTKVVERRFWYPFSHLAFLVYPTNTGDKNDKD